MLGSPHHWLSPRYFVTTGSPGPDPEPEPEPGERVRVYKRSLVYYSSGSVTKASIAALPELDGVDLESVELVFEAIGGGQKGVETSSEFTAQAYGGVPGEVKRATRTWDAVPSTISYTVGAGGQSSGGTGVGGGNSSIGDIVSALGGAQTHNTTWHPKDRSDGPGAGGRRSDTEEDRRGGNANAGTDLELLGGSGATDGDPAGKNATSPFQYGSGGAVSNAQGRGHGGRPGGGGGRGFSNVGQPKSGWGGGGACRIHIYVWETPEPPAPMMMRGFSLMAEPESEGEGVESLEPIIESDDIYFILDSSGTITNAVVGYPAVIGEGEDVLAQTDAPEEAWIGWYRDEDGVYHADPEWSEDE